MVSKFPSETLITKFKNNLSIKFINDTFDYASAILSFQNVSSDESWKEADKLNPKKAIQVSDIPNSVIKDVIKCYKCY